MRAVLALAVVAATLPAFAFAATPVQRGRALATKMCGQCHALGRSGQSPLAQAPAFRNLSRRLDLDTFGERLRDGLISGHKDMPRFTFGREDADAFVAYLRSIEAP